MRIRMNIGLDAGEIVNVRADAATRLLLLGQAEPADETPLPPELAARLRARGVVPAAAPAAAPTSPASRSRFTKRR
jgi:hypothetical protein